MSAPLETLCRDGPEKYRKQGIDENMQEGYSTKERWRKKDKNATSHLLYML